MTIKQGLLMTELTILMPCLNEAETLETCIVKAKDYLARSGVDGEVLIADNGSTDGSQDIAKRLGARVVDVPIKGYGAALGTGIANAKGRYIIMGDSDDSYDFSNLDPFVEELRDGADLVMGNRFQGGIAKNAMPPLHRYLGNPVLSAVGRIFYRTPVGDFHCGLRGFSREAINALHLNTPGMEFASEMVIRSTLFGLDIREVPTTLKPDGRSRPPHLRSWRDGWLHLKLLLTFAPYWLFYYPGLALFAIGMLGFSALMFGPITIGGISFDIASLILASALVLTGFQMVCFHVLTRIFAVRFNLLPTSPRYERFRSKVSVDNACILGGILLLIAFVATLAGVFSWGAKGFGDMIASDIVRPAALSVVCASLGVQVITTGFLSSMLQQPIRPDPEPVAGA
jgi:glycosyltransferase involved in cell wall biosynthesis